MLPTEELFAYVYVLVHDLILAGRSRSHCASLSSGVVAEWLASGEWCRPGRRSVGSGGGSLAPWTGAVPRQTGDDPEKTEKAVLQVTGVRQWQGRPRGCGQPTLPAVVTAVTVTEPHLVPSAAGTTAGQLPRDPHPHRSLGR